MKKRTLILVLSVAAIAVAAIGGTIAYFSAQAPPAANVFTVGNVAITLTEPNWDADNAVNIYPGEILDKDPIVTNTGANPCMVRVKVDKPFTDIDLIGFDSANWVFDNGFYYYKAPLAPGGVTSALFTGIKMPTSLTNEDSGRYAVTVTAQAVQSEGITDTTDLTEVIAMFDNAF